MHTRRVTRLRHRPFPRLLAAALLATLGCVDSPVEGPSTIYGRYTLQSVNGRAVPARIDSSAAGTATVSWQYITLYRGGTYTDSSYTTSTTPTGPGPAVLVVEKGVFQTLGVSITLLAGTRQRDLTWSAGRMTHVQAGLTWIYGL